MSSAVSYVPRSASETSPTSKSRPGVALVPSLSRAAELNDAVTRTAARFRSIPGASVCKTSGNADWKLKGTLQTVSPTYGGAGPLLDAMSIAAAAETRTCLTAARIYVLLARMLPTVPSATTPSTVDRTGCW
jgi:hypothetical protein